MATRVSEDMLQLGVALPWDLVNDKGRVVFRKGFVVNTEQSRNRLLSMQLFIGGENNGEVAAAQAQPAALASIPFSDIDRLADRVNETFLGVCQGPQPELSELTALVDELHSLYERYPDACLAAVHFNYNRTYGCLHAIYTTFLAIMLARAQNYSDAQRDSLARAALTANLGMYEYHDKWACSTARLSDEENAIRLRHPELSAERLESLGVTDAHWLDVVRHHHEMLDGSGYPHGLSGDAIHPDVQTLSIIDRYLAFVMPRVQRASFHPTQALREIYLQKDKYSERLTALFIKRMGVYPPGTAVQLANGEAAVITGRNLKDSTRPRVVSVGLANGVFYPEPVERDIARPDYAIKQVYQPAGDVGGHPALRVAQWV